jgi:hypothetical protein
MAEGTGCGYRPAVLGFRVVRLWRRGEGLAVEMGSGWGRVGAWWRWPGRWGAARGRAPGTEVTGWWCLARPLRGLPARVASMVGGVGRSFMEGHIRIIMDAPICCFLNRYIRITMDAHICGRIDDYMDELFGAVGFVSAGIIGSVAAAVGGVGAIVTSGDAAAAGPDEGRGGLGGRRRV